jgi:hypothetical protein
MMPVLMSLWQLALHLQPGSLSASALTEWQLLQCQHCILGIVKCAFTAL